MNLVVLIGNVGKDPETKDLGGDKKVCKFSLATKGYGKDAPSDWHNIVAWNKTAEIVEKYVKKGSRISIAGRISNRSYDNKDGQKVYTSEIIANEIELLGEKSNCNNVSDAKVVNDPNNNDLPY